MNAHNYNDVGPWMSGEQQNVTAFGVQELVFAPGESEKFIGIEIIDDSLPEPSEQFEVVLSNPRNGATLGEFVRGRVCTFSFAFSVSLPVSSSLTAFLFSVFVSSP